MHSLALAVLVVPRGMPSHLRLVHSRQGLKLGVLLAWRLSLAPLEVKACRAVSAASRLPLEGPLIPSDQTAALAHLLPRCCEVYAFELL